MGFYGRSTWRTAHEIPITRKCLLVPSRTSFDSFDCSSFAIWCVQASRLTSVVAYCGEEGKTFASGEDFSGEAAVDLPWDIGGGGEGGGDSGGVWFLYAVQKQTKTDVGYPTGIGIRNSLFVLGGINLLWLMCTFFVPEAKGEMSGDNITTKDDDQQETEMV